MRLLINVRLPLLRAIALSKQMIDYYPVESSLQKVEDDILKGKSLHQSLQQFSIYPSKLIQLIKVGDVYCPSGSVVNHLPIVPSYILSWKLLQCVTASSSE